MGTFRASIVAFFAAVIVVGAIGFAATAQNSDQGDLTRLGCIEVNRDGETWLLCPVDGNVDPGNGQGDPVDFGDDETGDPGDIGESFNPRPFYSQSCDPDDRCTWDVGAMGRHWDDLLQREVVQVGIVKGVYIEWDGNVAQALQADNGERRCSIMVIPPNTWLENLTIQDANVTVYDVWAGDASGWAQTLAVQAGQEQEANYGCPDRDNYPDDFDVWGSEISSPPCGVDGFDNCGPSASTSNAAIDLGTEDPAPAAVATDPDPAPGTSARQNNGPQRNNCETVNCNPRKTTATSGGSRSFDRGAEVYGYTIDIKGGRTYTNCYLTNAPGKGTVVNGVVNPWKAEVRKARSCR